MRVAATLSCSDSIRCEAEYAMQCCLSAAGLFPSDKEGAGAAALLCYGDMPEETMQRIAEGAWAVNLLHDGEGFESMLSGKALPGVEARFGDEKGVPVLFPLRGREEGRIGTEICWADGLKSALVSEKRLKKGGILTIHFDLLAAVFFFVSRVEEAHSAESDQFGRFPQESTLTARERFETTAAVNEYISLLQSSLVECACRSGGALLRKMYWPTGERYCVSLTHDVDRLAKWRGRSILKGILTAKLGEVLSSRRDRTKDPWWNIDRICEVERMRGVRSSFFSNCLACSRRTR